MTETIRLGVDGCPAGWLAIGLRGESEWEAAIWPNIRELIEAHPSAHQILIDIPIGLPYEKARTCDRLARQLLKQRRSSVFPVPSRAALQAKDYFTGCEVNQAKLGVRISKQAWNIGPKILEVDDWLQNPTLEAPTIRECHPELAFWGLQRGTPMLHGKKTQAGREARLKVLSDYWPKASELCDTLFGRYLRKSLAADDILDALALAITAQQAPRLRSLPETPERDETGLPMEIVFGEWS